jgi:hypothetical protein
MAIGDTVQAGLGRMDFSAFQRAGEAQARVGERMGQTVGGIIDQYQLNREKRNQLESNLQGQLSADPSIVQQLTMSGDETSDKKNMALFQKVQSGDASIADLERANGLLAGRTMQENAMMKKSAFEMSQVAQQLLNENRRLRNKYEAGTLDARVGEQKARTSIAQTEADYAPDQQTSTLAARGASTDATRQKTEQSEELFPLQKENIKSLIRSRDIYSAATLYKSMNVGSPVPQDVEKRFSDIGTQINKIDESQVRVRNTSGDEVTIPFKDFQKNPDDYAPQTSDRIKLLEMKKEGLIEEQSDLILDAKIPYTDPETGQKQFTTVREKMEYDILRAEKREKERQAQIEENKAKLPGAFGGIPTVPVMNY